MIELVEPRLVSTNGSLSGVPEEMRKEFWERAGRIVELTEFRDEPQFYVGKAPHSIPGEGEEYKDDTLIVAGNWNDIRLNGDVVDDRPSKAGNLLESMGFELEWNDQGMGCYDCNMWIRTEPDSYSWTPSYVFHQDSYVCLNCLDVGDYLSGQEWEVFACSHIDPSDHGYKPLDVKVESGFRIGGEGSPTKVLEFLRFEGFSGIFGQLESTGQFDATFTLWVNEDEIKEDDQILLKIRLALQNSALQGLTFE